MTKIEMVIKYEASNEADYADALDSMIETRAYYEGELGRNVVTVHENHSQGLPDQDVQQAADVLIILRPLL